jgi:hypothetical protein
LRTITFTFVLLRLSSEFAANWTALTTDCDHGG